MDRINLPNCKYIFIFYYFFFFLIKLQQQQQKSIINNPKNYEQMINYILTFDIDSNDEKKMIRY